MLITTENVVLHDLAISTIFACLFSIEYIQRSPIACSSVSRLPNKY